VRKKINMAKGISLHIGVGKVNEKQYGPLQQLPGAEQDARDMQAIAKKNKFTTTLLISGEAERASVIKNISDAAKKLDTGDFFLVSYSGHGGQFACKDYKDPWEKDGKDETWCLYDEQLIDDELYKLWTEFKKDVRIVILSDSCHSGTVTRDAMHINKTIRQEQEDKILKDNLEKYTERKKNAATDKPLKAQVLLLSACIDRQEAVDLGFNGAFTNALKFCLANDTVNNYDDLLAKVRQNIRKNKCSQTPSKLLLGNNPDVFLNTPFTI
jgi:hypothetical protein